MLTRRVALILAGTILLMAAEACSRNRNGEPLVVEIPSGFNGDFVLDMGNKGAAPLVRQGGGQYVVTVPKNGILATSSLLLNPQVTFKNSSDGTVWGYSHSVSTTGDGIPVGGKIEFFVGTKKDYEASQGKKKHSGDSAAPSGARVGV